MWQPAAEEKITGLATRISRGKIWPGGQPGNFLWFPSRSHSSLHHGNHDNTIPDRSSFLVCTAAFCIVCIILAFLGVTHALPLTPADGVHPNEKRSAVVCGAASWEDVLFFFLLTLVARAATIRHYPGDSTATQIWWTACALFLPFAGVWRACQSIATARPFEKDPLERAKYAGALCTIDDRYYLGTDLTELQGCGLQGKFANSTPEDDGFVPCAIRMQTHRPLRPVSQYREKIHGLTPIIGGYVHLSIVPPFVKVVPNCKVTALSYYVGRRVHLSCSNGLLKSAVAVVQLLFACLTLYRTKGDQVEMYGYAAFGDPLCHHVDSKRDGKPSHPRISYAIHGQVGRSGKK